MKFYKSFLFLLGLNLFLIWPVVLFVDLKFLIPAFVGLLILDLFLLFFSGFYLRKKFTFSVFSLDDPYEVNQLFENLKRDYNLKNIQLLKIKDENYSFFYFSYGGQSFVVLSENILENFSQEDIKCFLAYPFQMILSGHLLFLTLLSGFLFLMEKISYFLNYPLSFFKRKPLKKESLFLVFVLKGLSFMTRKIFYKMDQNLYLKEDERKKQALFLWRLDGLTSVKSLKVSPFLAPLFLTNPLTNSDWKGYISLQPLIENRVRALIGSYPP